MKKPGQVFALSSILLGAWAMAASAQAVALRGTGGQRVVGEYTCEGLGTDLTIQQPTGVWMILKFSPSGKMMNGSGERQHVRGNECRYTADVSRSSLTRDENAVGELTMTLTPKAFAGEAQGTNRIRDFRCPARTLHFELVGTNNGNKTLKFLGADDGFENGGTCFLDQDPVGSNK
jgi:hypothetical protein